MLQGTRYVEEALPGILADAEAKLSGALRLLLAQLKLELEQLDTRVGEADAVIQKMVCENEACQRLVKIPGIGPVTATAVVAAIGSGAAFRKGREFAAWMGVVPREHSTGGKQKLLGISERGNSYLRRLFVQGARAVLQQRTKQAPGLKAWLEQLTSRTHHNCWRTMRWHNGEIRRSQNPYSEEVFQDCLTIWEESVAHSILARNSAADHTFRVPDIQTLSRQPTLE